MNLKASGIHLNEANSNFCSSFSLSNKFHTAFMPVNKQAQNKLINLKTNCFGNLAKSQSRAMDSYASKPISPSTLNDSNNYFFQSSALPFVQVNPFAMNFSQVQLDFDYMNPTQAKFLFGNSASLPLKQCAGQHFSFANFGNSLVLDSDTILPMNKVPIFSSQSFVPIQIQPMSTQNTDRSQHHVQEQEQAQQNEEVKAKETITNEIIKEEPESVEELKLAQSTEIKPIENIIKERTKAKPIKQPRTRTAETSRSKYKAASSVCRALIVGKAYQARNVYKSIIRHIYTYTKRNKAYLRSILDKAGYTEAEIKATFETIHKYNDPKRPKEIERNTQAKVEIMLNAKSPLTFVLREVLQSMLDRWGRGKYGQLTRNNSVIYNATCNKFLNRIEEII